MKKLLGAFSLFVVISSSQIIAQSVDTAAAIYASTINSKDLSEYLHVLASDSLAGRETGKPGQKKAASYLAGKFKEFGLLPAVDASDSKTYFQKFELISKTWEDVYIKTGGKRLTFLEDFYAYGDINFSEERKLEPVFAGYGIEHANYSDYKNLNVTGKIAIIFAGEPVKDSISKITGTKALSDWANDWRKKSEYAKRKGAETVFMVVGKNEAEFKTRLNQLKHHIASPGLGFKDKDKASAVFIPIALAAKLLSTTPAELLVVKDNLANNVSISPFRSKKVKLKVKVKTDLVPTENVLGLIEGSDKKDEIVVLTAHYDHLGIENGKIHYGADDDGSGTAGLIEIAQAFAKAKREGHAPRRSVLIMPVTAEEKGLMGSEYYTDHPIFPLDKTVADLNIDMIGRLDEAHKTNENYIYIIGSNRLSTELHTINERANKLHTGLELDYTFNATNDPNRFYYRSDHYNFAKNNIPVIFYFSGVHEDYHKPTDTVDKINFSKMEKITRLVFHTAWELANREKKIEVDVK